MGKINKNGTAVIHKNEGPNHSLRKQTACVVCREEFKPGGDVVHHTWQTPVMPAPAFNVYHVVCFRKESDRRPGVFPDLPHVRQ